MSVWKIAGGVCLAWFLLSVAGCGEATAPAESSALRVVVETKPSPVQARQEAELSLDLQGLRVPEGAEQPVVTVHVEMQEMDHGEHVVPLEKSATGRYVGRATFPMGGDWLLHVRAQQGQQVQTGNATLVVQE